MTHKFSILGLVLLGCLLTVSLILLPGSAQARNIKVGVIDCYSGPAAVYGIDALNGFKLALSEINKKGVLGKKSNGPNGIPNSRWILPLAWPKSWL